MKMENKRLAGASLKETTLDFMYALPPGLKEKQEQEVAEEARKQQLDNIPGLGEGQQKFLDMVKNAPREGAYVNVSEVNVRPFGVDPSTVRAAQRAHDKRQHVRVSSTWLMCGAVLGGVLALLACLRVSSVVRERQRRRRVQPRMATVVGGGAAGSTLAILTSDNGAPSSGTVISGLNAPFVGTKLQTWYGVRMPAIAWWPKVIPDPRKPLR